MNVKQIEVCDQHAYETLILPLSVQFQWPRNVNFFEFLCKLSQPNVIAHMKKVHDNPWAGTVISYVPVSERSRNIKDLLDKRRLGVLQSAG